MFDPENKKGIAVASGQFEKERRYWMDKLSGELVKTGFPHDNHVKITGEPTMEEETFKIEGETLASLLKLGNQSDPAIHMILTAALFILLGKYTGGSDIIIGAPIYKQEKEGKFINTVLALRNQVDRNMSFKELLLQVRETITAADAHRNYPLELLPDSLELPLNNDNDKNGFPLFDIALLLENIHEKKYISHLPLNMIFSLRRTEDSIEGLVEYNGALYKQTTIRRLVGHYRQLLGNALGNVDACITRLEILTPAEKTQLLTEFNHTRAAYPIDKTIHETFEEQARKTPGNTAVVGDGAIGGKAETTRLTYRELNHQANRLAGLLRKKGVTTESVVGVMMERSLDTVTALLAVLKSGGAYLPIDTGLPKERVMYMLENSNAKALLSTSDVVAGISFAGLQGFESREKIQIEVTPPRPYIKDFDRIPIPDRTYLDLRNYKDKIGMASVTNCISLQTTRGCPYECLYCHKVWSKHHVRRSPENIYSEIEFFYKQGVRNFAIIDDSFNLDMKKSSQVFTKIIKNKLDIQVFFPNGVRGDILTPAYIDLMVEAGTRGINLSLETASPRLQKLLKKHLHLEIFKKVMEYIAIKHPQVILELATMHGFPTETEEEALMTLDFIKSIRWIHFPYIHILKIFPNTEMETFALEHGVSKGDILASRDRAFHELPETLPFPKSFTRKYQADFLNHYFLSKERLKQVLPYQMKIVAPGALAQKYNAYLPVEIKKVEDIITFARLEGIEIPADNTGDIKDESHTIFHQPPTVREVKAGALKILFLDLSQYFSTHRMLYNVVEQPLGLLYLLSYLKEQLGDQVEGRVYKSGNDFNDFPRLKALLKEYNPHLVAIRTLTFFKDFFHTAVSLIRQWGVEVPVITGGPYASSDYDTIVKDRNVDLVVRGEGEHTMLELIREMLKNNFKLPDPGILKNIQGVVYAANPREKTGTREIILTDQVNRARTGEETANPRPNAASHNLAYVMYTSGTTGRPKGVMVEHRQVNNCIHWMQDEIPLKSTDITAQRTNLSFDPSLWEIFWPLTIGAAVRVIGNPGAGDAEFLIRLLSGSHHITVMYCPAALVTAVTYVMAAKRIKPVLRLPWLIIGAEPISMDVVKKFYTHFQGKTVNTYGPTEGTINNTYYHLEARDPRTVVPIGKPIANNFIYILSESLQPVPLNIIGEICIAGAGVARGYISDRKRTEEVFIPNPFGEGKLYKTGDLGRWREDGNIEIMGRTDQQIKIRGYRIEPGEIEKVLLKHPGVSECLVLAKTGDELKEKTRECKKCGIWSNYPGVTINDDGICNLCENFGKYKELIHQYFKTPQDLEMKIKAKNRESTGKYDCLLVYACERVATYALYKLVEMGFRIMTATYDPGHYDQESLERIKAITAKIGVDHIFLHHPRSDDIMKESLKAAKTMCKGCIHTSSSLAGEYAYKNNIKFVIGETLSRGQIVENKLYKFIDMGVDSVGELETEILKLQRNTARIDKKIFDLINIEVVTDGSIYDKVEFIDFYRYFSVTNEEMIRFLDSKDPYWRNLETKAIYSTDCKICQVGNFNHLKEKGYHYTGSAKSWDQRLGLSSLEDVKEDLHIALTAEEHREFLEKLQYREEKPVEVTGKYLCAYFVSGEGINADQLKEYLAAELPHYMIPAYFIPLKEFPLTPGGKLDRKALPLPDKRKPGSDYTAPRDDVERKLAGIWGEVLGIGEEIIGIDANFFDLGGHSLNAVVLAARIHGELNVNIPITHIFQTPNISGLAAYIKKADKSKYIPVQPVEKKEYYALSSAQRRLYILQQMDEPGIGYNMPSIWQVEGNLEKEKLETVFQQLIQRHESLRTSFHMVNHEPVQRINEKVFVGGPGGRFFQKEPPWPPEAIIKNFIRPFDLSQAPLLRVGLIKLLHTPTAPRAHPSQEGKEGKSLLMVDMHHIISDGLSMGIFVKEVIELYAGKRLPRLKLQYRDYSEWHNRLFAREYIKEQEAYWLKQFAGEVPVLDLPTDYPRPSLQSFTGRVLHFEMNKEETAALKSLAREQDVTLFMLLTSLYTIFLCKISGQEDIVVGTPIAGRGQTDLQGIMGMFVNTLAVRNFPVGEKTFSGFLGEIKENMIKAFENQDYLYEDLVDQVEVERDTSRNPLFDVMFVLQNVDIPGVEIPGLNIAPYHYESQISKFDLTLTAVEIEGRLAFTFEYCTNLFKSETIQRFIDFFKKTVSFILENVETRISGIEIISGEEKNRILMDFNDTSAGYPRDKTIQQLFVEQVQQRPNQVALIGGNSKAMGEGARLEGTRGLTPFPDLVSITYRELNNQSNRLAHFLTGKGVKPDTIVGILVERSIEMIIGILGILRAGGAYLPIDPDYPMERVHYMLEDSDSSLVLTTSNFAETFKFNGEIIDIETGCSHNDCQHLEIINRSQDMVYMIYTSGSTGRPKGVMVKMEGFLNLLYWYVEEFGIGENENILLIAPISFDLAQKNLFSSHMVGGCLTLAPPGIPDYRELSEVIYKEQVTLINCAPSVFYPLIQLNSDRDYINLKSLRKIILGGEPIQAGKLLGWVNSKFYAGEIVNTYGPTECTDIASFYRIPAETLKQDKIIPIGKPISNVKVYILDKYRNLLPVGIIGELCIGGIGVSKGYYKNIELTAEKFVKVAHLPEKRVYQTGDLSRWLPDGTIEFMGRIDHQVKIRGFRIELGEIENRLLNISGVKDAVVLAREEDGGNKYICAYFVSDSEYETSGLREQLSRELPDYMVPSYFIQIEKIPLTPNGKINRKVLPRPGHKKIGAYEIPRNDIETKLTEIWADVLNRDPVQEPLGIHDNFFECGGHSLKAAILVSRINKGFNINLSLTDIFKTPYVAGLAARIKEMAPHRYTSIKPTEAKEYYPLSSAQKRMYVLRQVDKTGIGYNITSVLLLKGGIDIKKIENIFKILIERHESLRTSFAMKGQQIIQRIHSPEGLQFSVEYRENAIENSDFGPVINSFIRPFDFLRPPLLRAGVIKLDAKQHLFIMDIHHIAADGTSVNILVKEFMALYNREKLPRLVLQYKDYCQWQYRRREEEKAALEKQALFWQKELAGEIPALNLPMDFPRPIINNFLGTTIPFEITGPMVCKLKSMATAHVTTLFMVLLAVFNVVLAKLSGQEDIIVGTVTEGRINQDFRQIIGMFVNTLALRNFPLGEKRFVDFLAEVKEKCLAVFENQDYQFDELAARINHSTSADNKTIFSVVFVLENMESTELEIPGLKLEPYPWELKTSKFDLSFIGAEVENRIQFTMEYNTELFKAETITRYGVFFKQVLSNLLEGPQQRISKVEIIPDEEKRKVLYEFNHTRRICPTSGSIVQLFEAQAEKTPDCTAVVGFFQEQQHITYRGLNDTSTRLAYLLHEKGVNQGDIVGMIVERSIEMNVGILAIWKANAAYLPINPENPVTRTQYMLEDSKANFILVTPGTQVKSEIKVDICFSQGLRLQLIYMGGNPITTPYSTSNPHRDIPPKLAYIIYTSGSTGKPKGVPIYHANLFPLIQWGHTLGLNRDNRVVQNISYYFDWSVWEILVTLASGASLYIVPGDMILDSRRYVDFLNRCRITVLHITPMHLQTLLHQEGMISTLRYLCIGAEKLTYELVKLSYQWIDNKCRVFNMYGPTEATIMAAVLEIPRSDIPGYKELPGVPIGGPVGNTTLVIMDKYFKLCPVNIPGELYIGGDGLSSGYLNNPELTAEKFIRSDWSDKSDNSDQYNRSYMSYTSYIKIYKTGDLTRWLPDGNVEFLGRIDSQIKIRGFRIEPGEIENRLVQFSHVKEAVVLIKNDERGDSNLCAYIVSDQELDAVKLKKYLQQQLPQYMVPAYFFMLPRIPLTPNGKIDHQALISLQGTQLKEDKDVKPRDKIEETLTAAWEAVLGRDAIGIYDNFFMSGGDSIKAIQVVSDLYKEGYKTDIKTLFQYPTIAQLAGQVKAVRSLVEEEQEVVGIIPLTPIQGEFLRMAKIYPHHFNHAVMLYWEDPLPVEIIERIFKKIQQHHDALRITFKWGTGDEEPVVQTNQGNLDHPLSLHKFDLRGQKDPHALLQFHADKIQASIDLERGPLMKLGLFNLDDGDRLLIVIHHLVVDGVSWRILLEDIETLFHQYQEGQELKLPIKTDSFKTWAKKLREYSQSKEIREEERYWQNLDLLTLQEIKKDFEGDNYIKDMNHLLFHLNQEETQQLLTSVNRSFGTEVNEILLCALGLGIKETFGIEKVCVAVEGHGREEIFENINVSRTVGWFTTIYPVFLDFSRDGDVPQQLKKVKEMVRQIRDKGIGYGILKHLMPGVSRQERVFQVKPQVCFNYLGQFDTDVRQRSFTVSQEAIGNIQNPNEKRENEIDVQGMVIRNRLEISIAYSTKQFKTQTMNTLLQHFKNQLLLLISLCSDRKERELTPSDLTYKKLSLETVQELSKRYPLKDIYPLSPMQEGILFHSLYDPHSSVYLMQISFKLYGEVDELLVEKSLNQLVRRHDVLRTIFVYKELARPMQIVFNEGKSNFYYEDLRKYGEDEKNAFIKEFLARDLNKTFSLTSDFASRFSLLRLHKTEYLLHWSFHHILIDGWCLSILGSEFYEIYESYLEARPCRLSAAPPYARYIQWLERYNLEISAGYWRKQLEGFTIPTSLPKKTTGNSRPGFLYRKSFFSFNQEQNQGLARLALEYKVTVNTLMQAIWGIILAKYNGTDDVVFGLIVSGRPPEIIDVNRIPGLFINIIPLRIRPREGMKFCELLEQVHCTAIESNPHHHYPIADIQKEHPIKQGLLETIYAFQNYLKLEEAESLQAEIHKSPGIKRFKIEEFSSHEQTNNSFTFIVCPGKSLGFRIEYNENIYAPSLVEKLARDITDVVDQVTKNGNVTIRDIKVDYDLVEAKTNIYKEALSDF